MPTPNRSTPTKLAPCQKSPTNTDPMPKVIDQLVLWAELTGLSPKSGWYHQLGITKDIIKDALKTSDSKRLKLLSTIGAIVSHDSLLVLLRAKLAEQLLNAQSSKDLADAIRVFEKLPACSSRISKVKTDDQTPDENPVSLNDLESAIAEAKRVLEEFPSTDDSGIEAVADSE